MTIEFREMDAVAKIEAAKEHNIRFVQMQFTDIMGGQGVTIPLHQLEDSSSTAPGSTAARSRASRASPRATSTSSRTWTRSPRSRGSPVMATLGAGPLGSRGTARVICDVYTPNGEPFLGDPRFILKRQLERAKKLGYIWNTGPELEFFLFRREDGELKPLPHDEAGYFDFSTDLAEEVRQDMVNALEAFGIRVEAAHHEVAPGQHEIDFQYADGLRTADNAVTFKFTLKAIAQLHGLYATFMPKPIFGINGSGMHTHQSLWHIGREVQRLRRRRTTSTACRTSRAVVHGRHPGPRPRHDRRAGSAGELVQAAGARLRGADLPDLGPDQPLGADSRTEGLARPSDRGDALEVRCPDPSSNTYLAFACMLAAGLDGIDKGLELADPVEESLYEMTPERIRELGIKELPGTLARRSTSSRRTR